MVNHLPAAPDTVDVANRLRPTLLKLARELRREIHSLGVTGGQVSLLVAIKYAPGIGVRELAAQERMSPAAISKAVAKLEQRGLVERLGADYDRRVKLLVLTPEGRELRDALMERMSQPPELLANLPAADQRALRDILKRIADRA